METLAYAVLVVAALVGMTDIIHGVVRFIIESRWGNG